MRALVLGWLVACTPEIVSGAYLCGPEQDCPKDQACNGPDNACVIASTAAPFACDPAAEVHEPDDTPDTAAPITGLACVSSPFVAQGCLAAGDAQDWFRFTAPAACSSVEVQANVVFPVAFEVVGLELWDLGTMTRITADVACKNVDTTSENAACIQATLTLGGSYGIKVAPTGAGDCKGACNYNRYQLTVRLDTPG